MSARKPRIDGDGPSPLERLKALPDEAHEELLSRQATQKAVKIIGWLEQEWGIEGLSPQRLSDFWRWVAERREIRAAQETVTHIREIFQETMPNASAEETHKFLVRFLTATGFAKQDLKTLKFVTVEERKRMEGEREQRRIEMLERKLETAKETLSDAKLTPEEQMARMKEVFGLG